MLNLIIKKIRSITMAKRAKAIGTKFFSEGTQNQQI